MSLSRLIFSTGARRKPEGLFGQALKLYAVLTAAYTVYGAAFSSWDNLGRIIIFLCLMLVLVFQLIGARPGSSETKPALIDYALTALSLACLAFFAFELENIAVRISLFDDLSPAYFFFGLSIILLSLEAARRTVGLGLTIVVCGFMAYNLFGHLLSGPMSHGHITLMHLVDLTVFTTDGLFGVPLQVTATYAFMFVLFGTLLEKAGGGDFFFDMAAVFTGRRVGGPAKVAVMSSAMFGTISGSPTSDVVTTGSVTIPMMKRLGYDDEYASAVEVAASTGGSLLPPVMGSAVFIMAEFTGISYLDIAIACLFPALLFYLGVYIQVHLRSLRLGHRGLPADRIPTFAATMRRGGLFLVPLVTLVTALVLHYTPTYVALFGVVSVLLAWLIRRQGFTLRALYDAVAQTTFNMVAVTGACAVAGLVIGGITMTGLAGKVSDLILMMAGANMLLSLVIAAASVILLGMGMPTPAAYALAAALIAPTLTKTFEIPMLQAHLFLLYFAVLSAMTPPVAVAAYAASAISGRNPLGIAVKACRLAMAAFILPFALIYDPGILLRGDLLAIFAGMASALIAVVLISVAAEGYFKRPLSRPVRILGGAAGIAFLAPGLIGVLIGSGLLVAAVTMAQLARSVEEPLLAPKED
jgi:TRAP transporter 4TM/12TM fusion protein